MLNTETNDTAKIIADVLDFDIKIVQAYVELVGEEYATAEDLQEAYAGFFYSDEEFAENMAEGIGAIDDDVTWPHNYIDWTRAAQELMYDYAEQDHYYFRNM